MTLRLMNSIKVQKFGQGS